MLDPFLEVGPTISYKILIPEKKKVRKQELSTFHFLLFMCFCCYCYSYFFTWGYREVSRR